MKEIFKSIGSLDVKKIKELDLELLLPHFGMNDEIIHEMPLELSSYFGKGIKFWQYPNQLSPYLIQLSKFKIKSYLEIGCRWGGTFIITNEILKSINGNIKSYACDIKPISNILKEYKEYSCFEYLHQSSFSLDNTVINHNVDLIFIDGDHSYEALKKDFDIAKQYSPKYIVFHDIVNDICPGVVMFWNEIKNNYKYYEYTKQYDSVKDNYKHYKIDKKNNKTYLGIGLIEI